MNQGQRAGTWSGCCWHVAGRSHHTCTDGPHLYRLPPPRSPACVLCSCVLQASPLDHTAATLMRSLRRRRRHPPSDVMVPAGILLAPAPAERGLGVVLEGVSCCRFASCSVPGAEQPPLPCNICSPCHRHPFFLQHCPALAAHVTQLWCAAAGLLLYWPFTATVTKEHRIGAGVKRSKLRSW